MATADLIEYVGALTSSAKLLDVPPHPSLPEAQRQSWVLADTLEYAGLECWAWGLEAWGRAAVARAACSVAELAHAVMEPASRSPSRDFQTYLDNVSKGVPSAAAQIAAARAWLREPTPATVASAVATFDHEGLINPDFLELPELDSLRREAWPWACVSALGAAVLVEHPMVPYWISRTFVSAARALVVDGLESEAACLSTWAAVQAGFESPV